ncbi:MAG: PAS domain-containing sensor histidine kinase [Alphaproteobacteria bacterium]|jgi:signal transduction histidine kinase|nr:PAS domain-containing sensor histidine kinase [Alphaproteobacteria bacterium]
MLHAPTLFAVLSLVTLFVALLVALAWRGDSRYAGMRAVKYGLSFMAAGFLIQTLRSFPVPQWAVTSAVLVANFLLVCGVVATLNGSVALAGARPGWRRDIAASSCAYAVFLYYLLAEPMMYMRILSFGLCNAFMFFGGFLALRRLRHDPVGRRTRKAFSAFLVLDGISEIARGLGALYPHPVTDFSTPSPVLTLFPVGFIFGMLAFTVLSLQLVNERLQRDMRRSEDRIARAFDVASDAFFVVDSDGDLVSANARFGDLFPAAAGRALPGAAIDQVFGDPARFGIAAEWLTRDETGFLLAEARHDVFCPSGDRWVHVSAARTDDGGLVLCWADITDFKQAEAVLANELAHQKELAAMQRSFVAMASHQFRTPLSIIDLDAQLMEDEFSFDGRPGTVSGAARIRLTVQRLIRLIELMLGAASAEEGRIEPNRSPTDLALVVQESCARMQETMPSRLIEVDTAGLPPSVICDANVIEHVINNLLSNAIKYSSKTQKVIVRGYVEDKMAVVAITDFGVGIAPEDQPQIFERFFRASNARSIAGTGIGLTLARYIVDLHGGEITVQSALGAGSTFMVRLPMA